MDPTIEAGLLDEGTLLTVAPDTQVTPEIRGSGLHDLLVKIPARRWARYRDLADAMGSSPPGFTWTDETRDDDPRELLEAEGVRFDDRGRADPAQRYQLA